jgi:hypothetical protein
MQVKDCPLDGPILVYSRVDAILSYARLLTLQIDSKPGKTVFTDDSV